MKHAERSPIKHKGSQAHPRTDFGGALERSPKPETRNPKPETRNWNHRFGGSVKQQLAKKKKKGKLKRQSQRRKAAAESEPEALDPDQILTSTDPILAGGSQTGPRLDALPLAAAGRGPVQAPPGPGPVPSALDSDDPGVGASAGQSNGQKNGQIVVQSDGQTVDGDADGASAEESSSLDEDLAGGSGCGGGAGWD